MTLLSLSFHDDGAPRQRTALRDHLAAGGDQVTLDCRTTPWTTLLQTLRWARRQAIPIHCEQPPPPHVAWLLSAFFPAKHLNVHATCWPRKKERAPLPAARWYAATPALAKAWQGVGVIAPVVHSSLFVLQSSFPIAPAAGCPPTLTLPLPGGGNQRSNILWLGPLLDPGPALSSLWAFDVLSIIHPTAHLHLCGTGPGEASLRQFARNLPAHTRIHFHPTATADLWREASMLWVNDPTAAVPDAWVEAVTHGVPCLVANTHAATGYATVDQPLKSHAPPAWAGATRQVLEAWRSYGRAAA